MTNWLEKFNEMLDTEITLIVTLAVSAWSFHGRLRREARVEIVT